MASLKQIESNRNNAQHSSGPTTDAGKAESAKNSFKTGMYSQALIIRGEKREDFDTLKAEYYERYEPEGPEERDWLDRVIRIVWQLRRYDLVEAHTWEHEIAKGADQNTPLGEAFSNADQKFGRLQRMVAATQRALKEAQQELERVRGARQEEHPSQVIHKYCWVDPVTRKPPEGTYIPEVDPETLKPILDSTASRQIGFVPSTPRTPCSSARGPALVQLLTRVPAPCLDNYSRQ